MAGGILREGGVPEKETEEMWKAWRREQTKERRRQREKSDRRGGWGWQKEWCTRRRRWRGRDRKWAEWEHERGEREPSLQRASPFSWKEEQGPRRRGGRIDDDNDGGDGGREGFRREGGFRTAKAVGPRTVASTLPPLSVASRFPDTADRHWQVSESNSRSFTSQPTRIVFLSFSLPPSVPFSLSPSLTLCYASPFYNRYTPPLYIHVSRVISAVDDRNFSSAFRDGDVRYDKWYVL